MKLKRILLTLISILLVFIAVVGIRFYTLGKPSKGEAISSYSAPKKALVVIDIQEDFTGKTAKPPFPFENSDKLISKVNNIIKAAQDKGFVIVYIRHEFGTNLIDRLISFGRALKGSKGAQIDSRISIISNNIFLKNNGDSFTNPKLDEFLIKNQVNELYLLGLDGAMCVNCTANGANNRRYKINIIEDAVVTKYVKTWEKHKIKYKTLGINLISSDQLM